MTNLPLGAALLLPAISVAVLSASADMPAVTFVETAPIIDGQLDEALTALPKRTFNHVFDFGNPETDPVTITYRLAYTPTHLYLYIETSADEVSYHRRGYLWGDGYKLLLGFPKDGALTNEFYEMTFSPTQDESYAWDHQRIAAYNFVQNAKAFSNQTLSQEKSAKGASGFEALIAWDDIKPYHPWFSPEFGYNLYFAKGFNTEADGYFTNGHAIVEDEGIWDEEIEFRNTAPITFEKPDLVTNSFLKVAPQARNLTPSDPLVLDIVAITETAETIVADITLRDQEEQEIFTTSQAITTGTAPILQNITLNDLDLETGTYTLALRAGVYTFETEFSVRPIIDYETRLATLKANQDQSRQGVAETLIFKLLEIKDKFEALPSYETGAKILEQVAIFQAEFEIFMNGQDPYIGRSEVYRRAFKSDYDSSYQPYSIRLPDEYDPSKPYPLLVFMHGSGQDEQSVLRRQRGNGHFIELAPFGRDKFRAYASEASQVDIVEAIEDVKANFNINADQIVIGGFSMGGYGALRAFYENPNIYRGVAVFAGHPNLASEWLGEPHPNFLDETYLDVFKGVPVFVYHGRKDAALPIALMEEMISQMKEAGADPTVRFIDDKGHTYQDNETHALFGEWLMETIE